MSFFKMAKKEELVRRLEGDLSSLQETVKSYAEEVREFSFTLTPEVKRALSLFYCFPKGIDFVMFVSRSRN